MTEAKKDTDEKESDNTIVYDYIKYQLRLLGTDILKLKKTFSSPLPNTSQSISFVELIGHKRYEEVFINSEWHKTFSKINEYIYKSLEKTIESLNKVKTNLSNSTGKRVADLGKNGWYCDVGNNQKDFFSFLLDTISKEKANTDERLTQYYSSNLTRIEENLIKLYPHREKFLNKGFSAHKKGDYIVSIPLLLMFTDGITFEKVDTSIYGSNKNSLRINKSYLDNLEIDELQRATLSAISNFTAINQKESSGQEAEINRNVILHGKNLTYGTEINSLKIISFANYVAGIFNGWPSEKYE